MSSIQPSVAAGTPPQASNLVQEGIIPVPPPQPLPNAPELAQQTGLVPACLVLILAFFLASTPARNSDFWLHLATGKALVQGQYHFGVEPFTAGESSAYWANPSWLYDVLIYFLYQTLGGMVLVILKGFLLAGMAWLMIATGRSGKGLFLSSLTAALALVAMGPWLALKPLCLSFFFLAWTIWYLEKRLAQEGTALTLVSFWPVLLVCAFWANLDRWFFFGPLTIGFFFLGGLLSGKTRSPAKTLGWLFLSSVAICLLNPHHFYLWLSVPGQVLSAPALQLQADPFLQSLAAPFQSNYFSRFFFQSPPALAFWLLAVLGLLSFCLDFNGWPRRWFLLWGFLFLLSLAQTPAIPFFAIVSSPILARNLASWLTRPQATWKTERLLPLGRVVAFLTVTALALAAWPGWLQIGPYGPRAWRVEMDPGIQAIGEKLALWHEQGKKPAQGKIFPFNPDTGNYLAWLCPQIPCWLNGNLHLTENEAEDYLSARQGLTGMKLPGIPQRDWYKALHQSKVSLLVVHGGDPATLAVMKNLNPEYLLAFRGKGAVIAWRDPWQAQALSLGGLKADLLKETYSFTNRNLEITAPERSPRPLRWWDAYWRPRYFPSVDRDEANTLLAFFDGFLNDRKAYYLAQSKMAAELVWTMGFPNPGNLNGLFQGVACPGADQKQNSALNAAMVNIFLQHQDDGPPEILYLALRACRRALQANPDDGQAFFLLGEIYSRLGTHTRERTWAQVLGDFRIPAMLASFHQALLLNPSHWQSHDRMREIFQSMAVYKDLTLYHLKEVYKIRAAGQVPGESREQYKDRMGLLKNVIFHLEKEEQSLKDRLTANSENLRIADRANLAGKFGLSGTALNILLKSDIAAFGPKGLEMELKLLVNTGQLDKVKNWLEPKHQDLLGERDYHLIRAQVEAGLGNYSEADKALQNIMAAMVPGGKKLRPIDMLAMEIGNALLVEVSGGPLKMLPLPGVNFMASKESLSRQIANGLSMMERQAVSQVLQGIFALEGGANKKAHAYFLQAHAFWNSPAGNSLTDENFRTGRQIARYFLHQLEKANP